MTKRSKALVADGRALAVEMLEHFEQYPLNRIECSQWSLEAKYREKDTEQDNVVLRYLRRCRDPQALAGFCSVLTDYIGSHEEGAGADKDTYEHLTEREISGRPGTWPDPNEEFEKGQAALRRFMGSITGERRV